jgi:hypothetical protein
MRRIRPVLQTLLAGTLLGLLILGVGGRLAMAAIQADMGASPSFSLGGTSTVIFLGALSGLAGAGIALVSGAIQRRVLPRQSWLRHALFAALLFLVTMRGLRGTPSAGWWYFYLLVAMYFGAMILRERREEGRERKQGSGREAPPHAL